MLHIRSYVCCLSIHRCRSYINILDIELPLCTCIESITCRLSIDCVQYFRLKQIDRKLAVSIETLHCIMPAKKKVVVAVAASSAAAAVPQTWPDQAPTVAAVPTVDAEILLSIDDPDKFGGIVAASKFIIDRLIVAGLAREIVIPPASLGLHPCNRGKYGCHEDSVHQLAADIVEVGWDWNKVRGGVCGG